ncbi:MAG: phosphatidate cytidylyltransferase [Candidatus Binatia bacterium]|nr:MAG: phosphatidate cytidylyltransferase [Candidatus Binatia bacterium]
MLRLRLATAAVALPLLLVLVLWAPDWLFSAVVVAVATLGTVEYSRLGYPPGSAERILFPAVGLGVALGVGLQEFLWIGAALTFGVGATLGWVLLGRRDFVQGLIGTGQGWIGIFFSAFLLPHFVWLRTFPEGKHWVLFVLAVAMLGDTAGYFAGKLFGRHKLAPAISPGKTVEGAVAVAVGNLVAGAGAWWLLLRDTNPWEALALALVLGTLGQAGDLSESMMKRSFGVKESGGFFPGHGGILDRIDSLVFPAAFLCYYLAFRSLLAA